MKKKILLVFLIILILGFLILLYFCFKDLYYNNEGSVNINNDYSLIEFSDIKINYDIDMSLREENNTLYFDINELDDFVNEKEFYVTLRNIGNINNTLSKISISEFKSSIERENVDIKFNLKNGTLIEKNKSELLKISISIKDKPNEDVNGTKIKNYMKFKVNFVFDK